MESCGVKHCIVCSSDKIRCKACSIGKVLNLKNQYESEGECISEKECKQRTGSLFQRDLDLFCLEDGSIIYFKIKYREMSRRICESV